MKSETLNEQYFGREHVTVIEPQKPWRILDFKELWAYRELLWVLIMRDIKVRYKQTILGSVWAILPPVMMMLVFSIFFGRLAQMPSEGYPYPLFVYAALLPWTFFAQALTTSGFSLVGSAQLVSKVYFPRIIIPLSAIGGGLLDFFIATLVLLPIMAYFGTGWSINLLLAPFFVISLILTALGSGMMLSALTVAYRDFRHVVPFLVQFWLFATPVVYPVSLMPTEWRWALYFNPMVGMVEAFRFAFLGKPFDLGGFAISFVISVGFFFVGIAYFEKVERRFADII
jgi:lipopolysaccharide transport system permease protein